MAFIKIMEQFKTFDFENYFKLVTSQDIENSLGKTDLNKYDLLNLLSDNALAYIEQMAVKANMLTRQYFGNIISLYAPLYISDYCQNHCTYCGFNQHNKFVRKKLSIIELENEAELIYKTGIRHILILTGEDHKATPMDYLVKSIKKLSKYFSSISLEIFPMDINDYKILIQAGADSLTIYQEVYDKTIYKDVHLKGRKKDYNYRLMTPERGAHSGFRAINIGTLFGLGNIVSEAFFSGIHAQYLEKNYPDIEVSLSIPRMTNAMGSISPKNLLKDAKLVQIMLAWRLFMPRLGISVSTREPSWLRDKLIYLGATKFSAGSKTNVGGYSNTGNENTPQFELSDTRKVEEIAGMIREKGYQPIFKDWERP